MSALKWSLSSRALTILFFGALSLMTALKACYMSNVFVENNTRVFDGVTYEYRRQVLFDRFNNDFSAANRYSRAYYEWDGNFGSGGYHALLCLVAPKWLSSGLDIPLRGAFAMFTLLVALYLFLKPFLSPVRIGLISLATSQLPSLCDPMNGIGTYIPDSVAAMLLMAAILYLLVFIRNQKPAALVLMAALLITGAVFIRFNFVIHSGLAILSLSWPVARALKNLPIKKRIITISLCSTLAIMVTIYFLQQLDRFLSYYNETIYDQVSHAAALSISMNTFSQSMGWWGIALILAIPLLVLYPSKNKNLLTPKYHLFLMTLPFILLYGIPIFVKRAPYIPHVLNSSFLTLPLVMVSLGLLLRPFSSKFPFPDSVRFSLVPLRTAAVVLGSVIIVFSSLNFAQAVDAVSKTLPSCSATRIFTSIVEQEARTNSSDTVRFMAFFDDLVHYPVYTALRKDHKLPTADFVPFITKPSLMGCTTPAACSVPFKEELKNTDLVAVNNPMGPVNINLRAYRLAQSVVSEMYDELSHPNSGFIPIDTINSEVHGQVIIFKSLQTSRLHKE